MGVVYLVEDMLSPGESVALKAVTARGNNSLIAALEREFLVLSRMFHPNIAAARELGFDPERRIHFLTFEYVRGVDIVSAASSMSPADFTAVLGQALDALRFIHFRGVVHYDLKPSNVLVRKNADGSFTAKLIDFGLAGQQAGTAETLKGTPGYIAPEMVSGAQVDFRADLYALGKTAAAAIRNLPESGTGGRELLERLNSTVAKLSEENPSARLQSADDALDALLPSAEREKFDKTFVSAVFASRRLIGRDARMNRLGDIFDRVFDAGAERSRASAKHETTVFRAKDAAAAPKKVAAPLVLVSGESGSGKRALLSEFTKRSAFRGVDVLSCEFERSAAFERIIELMALFAGRYASRSPAALGIPDAIKSFETAGRSGGKPLPADWKRTRFLVKIASHIIDLSAVAPLVLVFGNMQNLDESAAEFLDHLIRAVNRGRRGAASPAVRMMIVGRASSDEQPSAPFKTFSASLEEDGLLEKMELDPLSKQGALELVRDILALQDVPAEFFDALYSASRGVPLYVLEMLKGAADRGLLEYKHGRWSFNLPEGADIRFPAAVDSILARRLADLPSPAMQIAIASALFGNPPSLEMLARVAAVPKSEFENALVVLRAKNIAIEESGKIRFIEPRLKDIVAEGIPAKAAGELHARIFEALSSKPDAGAAYFAGLAFHAERAGLVPQAARNWDLAGDGYLRLHLYDRALKAFLDARRLFSSQKRNAAEDIALAVKIATLKEALGDLAGALDDVKSAVALSRPDAHLDAEELATLHRLMGGIFERMGDGTAALQSFRRGLFLLHDKKQSAERAALTASVAWVLFTRGRFIESVSTSIEALKSIPPGDETPEHASIYSIMAAAYSGLGDVEQSCSFYERALEISRRAGMARDVAACLNGAASAAIDRADYGAALQMLSESMELSAACSDVYAAASGRAMLAKVKAAAGRLGEARREAAEAARLADENGMRYIEALALEISAGISVMEGDSAAGLAEMRRSRRLYASMENACALVRLGVTRSRVELALGDIDAADAASTSALESARGLESKTWLAESLLARAGVLARSGNPGSALEMINEALSLVDDAAAPETKCRLHHDAAEIMVERGMFDDAKEQYARMDAVCAMITEKLPAELRDSYKTALERRFGKRALGGGKKRDASRSAEKILMLADSLGAAEFGAFVRTALAAALDVTPASRALYIERVGAAFKITAAGAPSADSAERLAKLAAEKTLEEKRNLQIDDVRLDARFSASASVSTMDAASILACPAEAPGGDGAVLYLEAGGRAGAFEEDDYECARRIARLIGVAAALKKTAGRFKPSEPPGDFEFFK
jgi:serine/threonine protein kinase/tetratricopeptide (TPR) repeat protein